MYVGEDDRGWDVRRSWRGAPALVPLAGAAVLGVVLWRLGTAPFLRGLRAVDARTVAVAVTAGALATVACAWRWRLVAARLGVDLALPAAVAAYYRSQLLNTVLPGGVLGDVHRGVRQGRSSGDLGVGLRAVGYERLAGQAVQVTIVLLVLVLLPSPVRHLLPVPLAVLALAVAAVLLLGGRPRLLRAEVGRVLLHRSAWPGVVVSSAVVVAAHTATFVVATTAAGTRAPLHSLVPLALVNLMTMSVPLSLAGWGPREGGAAWSFAAYGHGAAQGVAAATTYGVLAAVATLPGAVVLLVAWARQRDRAPALVVAGA